MRAQWTIAAMARQGENQAGRLCGVTRICIESCGAVFHPSCGESVVAKEYWFEEGCWITELSNTADDPALSIARARVPPGATTRWHRLRGVVERYVILSGCGVVEVGDEPPRPVGAGDVVHVAAGIAQRIHNPGAQDLVFLALCTPRFTTAAYEDIDAA